jgi:hypothetical protein
MINIVGLQIDGVEHYARLAACFMLVSYLSYSLTLKMGAICSSETSVDFHRTTQLYTREDITLQAL